MFIFFLKKLHLIKALEYYFLRLKKTDVFYFDQSCLTARLI